MLYFAYVLQYFYLTPASLLVDVLRLAVLTRPTGYSILVMVQLLEMLAKVGYKVRKVLIEDSVDLFV